MELLIKILPSKFDAISIDDLLSDFWKFNKIYLNNYFNKSDVPYFSSSYNEATNRNNIEVCKLPDDFKPAPEDVGEDLGIYPFMFDIDKENDSLYPGSYFDQIDMYEPENKKPKNFGEIMTLARNLNFNYSISTANKIYINKIVELMMVLVYIIAKRLNGIISVLHIWHQLVIVEKLQDKIINAAEYLEIILSFIGKAEDGRYKIDV